MKRHLLLLVLLGAVAIVHGPVLGAGLLTWDDDRFTTANPLWQAGGWDYVARAFQTVQFESWQPLHVLCYGVDRLLWPRSPAGFHALSFGLFLVGCAGLYALSQRRVPPVFAAAAVLLFAVHPLVVEPVAWVAARKDLLAFGFCVGALLLEDRRAGAGPVWGAVALSALAMLSKSSAVCLPLVLAVWHRTLGVGPERAPLRLGESLSRLWPHVPMALVSAIVSGGAYRAGIHVSEARPAAAPFDVLASLGLYARRVVWPSDLAAIYPSAVPGQTALVVVVALVAVVLASTWRRLPPAARYAPLAFVAAVGPVVNLVPLYFRYGDRFTLLALAFVVPALAIGLCAAWARLEAVAAKAVLATATTATFVLLATTAHGLTHTWRDELVLFGRATKVQPAAYFARLKHGEGLRERERWAEGVAQYQAAIRLRPDDPLAYVGLFHVYATRAEKAGALAAGTAQRWLASFGPALAEPGVFATFLAEVVRSPCAPCKKTLLVIGLDRFPQSDAALVASAEKALAGGAADVALVYLNAVRDQSRADVRALIEMASQAGRGLPR